MEHLSSPSLLEPAGNESELSNPLPAMLLEAEGGQINLKLMGFLTLIVLVFTARTPFAGGLSLKTSYQ